MTNMPIGEKVLSSVSDYIDWSKNCSKKFGLRTTTLNPWFRGHRDETWLLKPLIYRRDYNHELEREMLRDFRANAAEFLEHKERSDIDWLFLAQHYGLPTRLLDWSENPLVALYFACQGYKGHIDGCVWALNPWELNKTNLGAQTVPPTDAAIITKYLVNISDAAIPRNVTAEHPIAFRPFHRFRRSNAQSGMFTIHGTRMQGIEKSNFFRNKDACLIRAIIPANRKFHIIKDLYNIGIHHGSLFHSIESSIETIKFRYSDFMTWSDQAWRKRQNAGQAETDERASIGKREAQ
jgi:hypothetical protein